MSLNNFYSLVDDETKDKIAKEDGLTGSELFKPKPKIDKNSALYNRNLSKVFSSNGFSYPLVDKVGNLICEVVYIGGNNLFLGVIEKSFILNLKNYNNLYSIQISDGVNIRIININRSNITITSDYELMILQTPNNIVLSSLTPTPLIPPVRYMLSYNIGKEHTVFYEYNKTEQVALDAISNSTILLKTDKNINIGSPLISDGYLTGILYKEEGYNKYYVRISSYNHWLNEYIPTSIKKITQYSSDELYHIIHQLNHKVIELETQLNNSKTQ